MTHEPRTLRHLITNAKEGFASKITEVRVYSDGKIERTKLAAFKLTKEGRFLWLRKDKWRDAHKHVREIAEFFVIDHHGYDELVHGKQNAKDRESKNIADPAVNMTRIMELHSWKEKRDCKVRREASVYSSRPSESPASIIYENLESRLREMGYNKNVAEFTTAGLNCIADMVSVQNNKIVVYEIKSEADTLKRLHTQIVDYRKYADFIWLVLDNKFKKGIQKYEEEGLLNNVGIVYHSDGVFDLSVEAEQIESNFDKLTMLWGIEKQKILAGLSVPYSAKTKDGTRSNRIKNLCLQNTHKINEISRAVIISRLENFALGKRPKGKKSDLSDCAGSIMLSKLLHLVYGVKHAESVLESLSTREDGCTVL